MGALVPSRWRSGEAAHGRLLVDALVLLLFSWAGLPGRAADAAPDREDGVAKGTKRLVLVAPFENLSRYKASITYEVATGKDPDKPKRAFRVDRYSEAPRGILEDAFANADGLSVVERQRVDALLLESDFSRVMSDSASAVKLGKMLGAQAVVMGTVSDVSSEVGTFKGYGISARRASVSAEVRVRVVDTASGEIVASKTYFGREVYESSQFGGLTNSDVAYAVIKSALSKVADDAAFLRKAAGRQDAGAAETVEVSFEPVPTNAEVEIDGSYRGGTPLAIKLPAGKPVKVIIRKAGHESWERTIVPGDVKKVTPELAVARSQPAAGGK